MQQKVDFIQQPGTTSSVVGLRRSSKALLKAQLAPNKGHGHSLVVCCWSDPSQLSESWRNHYTWEACSADWWNALVTTEATAGTDQQERPRSSPKQGPTHATQPALQTLSKLGCEGSPHPLCSSHLSPNQPITISSRISIIFCRENISTTSSMQRMLFKSPSNLKAWVFTL